MLEFPNDILQSTYDCFFFMLLANRADPDEMPHAVAFHLGLDCLPMQSTMAYFEEC